MRHGAAFTKCIPMSFSKVAHHRMELTSLWLSELSQTWQQDPHPRPAAKMDRVWAQASLKCLLWTSLDYMSTLFTPVSDQRSDIKGRSLIWKLSLRTNTDTWHRPQISQEQYGSVAKGDNTERQAAKNSEGEKTGRQGGPKAGKSLRDEKRPFSKNTVETCS